MTRCDSSTFKDIVDFIKALYQKETVPLHSPIFLGKEKEYITKCIDSTFVSYLGEFVNEFERMFSSFAKAGYAVAVVNGTVGLHISLKAIGVGPNDEVVTQPLTFVATANAIAHCGAVPTFVDVDRETLGMCPHSLGEFLKRHTAVDNGILMNKETKRRIAAVVPVHTFGHPCRIDEIVDIAKEYNLPVIEDAAEAVGSLYNGKHCGTFGLLGVFSFNGNKTITTGGGGMVVTDDPALAQRIRHLTTTAKVPHQWEYAHDDVGYNYRMPNINAALGAAQMEYIDQILANKRETAMRYKGFFDELGMQFFVEPKGAASNYWLNAILLSDKSERDEFLSFSNANGVMARPAWRPMHMLGMYANAFSMPLPNTEWLADRLANIPSGVRT